MNGYNLIRNWYAFKFDNPSKCKAIHSDMYCYLVDLWNRLGQKEEFGLPTQMTMEVLGIGSYNTYKKSLDSLIEFGFVVIVKDSINQHQSKIVALSNFDKANDKALDKATIKATDEALDKATDTIYKPINQVTNKSINHSIDENKFSPEIRKLTQLLFTLIFENNDKAKKPNYDKWDEHIEKLHRIDGYDLGQIEYVIKWCQQDSFWKSNILSTKKLREKFGSLVVKIKSEKEKKVPPKKESFTDKWNFNELIDNNQKQIG